MTTLTLKRSSVPSKVPLTSDLSFGEIGINTYDGRVFIKKDNGSQSIVDITKLAEWGSITGILANQTDLQNILNTKINDPGSNGIVIRNGSFSSILTRSIEGTTSQIEVLNSNGTAGNPTISIANNPIIPGNASITIPIGTTAQRPSSPTDGMIRYNSTDEVLEGYSSPYGLTASSSLLQRTAIHRKRVVLRDDFLKGSEAATGAFVFGDLRWSVTQSGTNANSFIDATADHPGVLQLQTGKNNGNSNRMHLGATPTRLIMMANQVEYFSFIIKIPIITSLTSRYGLGTDISAANFGTNGVFFEFNPAVSNSLQFITRSSSVSTSINTVTVAANTWYFIEAFYDGTTWTPVVNQITYPASSTNIPSTAINVGVFLQTNTGVARAHQIDNFELITTEMGARY